MREMFQFVLLLTLSLLAVACCSDTVFNVLHYAAVGDGKTEDTKAFAKAWEATCKSSSSSPTMHVPSDRTFLIQQLILTGPCKSRIINVEINGTVVAPNEPSDWQCHDKDDCRTWIQFRYVDGLVIRGHGTIHGRGEKWWQLNYGITKPTALDISICNNVYLGGGLIFKNNPRVHVNFFNSRAVSISNVTIDAPEDSPNTDGIHFGKCTDVHVENCLIRTGDDCISIVDGNSNMRINNILCGPGHGISIGSLGKHGAENKVENVHVSDVVFRGTQNGARIKTWQGGKGYARHILFERILSQESRNPIIIDQFYCIDHEQCMTQKAAVQVSNVTFRQFIGTSSRELAVILNCSETVLCKDIVIDDVYILTNEAKAATFECRNVRGRVHGQKVPQISCLTET